MKHSLWQKTQRGVKAIGASFFYVKDWEFIGDYNWHHSYLYAGMGGCIREASLLSPIDETIGGVFEIKT